MSIALRDSQYIEEIQKLVRSWGWGWTTRKPGRQGSCTRMHWFPLHLFGCWGCITWKIIRR